LLESRIMRRITMTTLMLAACTSGPPEAPSPTQVQLGGTYELANRIDLTTAGVLPPLASGVLSALAKLETDPAGAIVGILEATNAPIAAQVLSAIPSALQQPLLQWIDDHVFAAVYQNVPVTMQVAGIVSDIAQLVTAFQLDTELVLAEPDATGATTATHALAGATFTVAGHSLVVRAPELLSQLTQASLQATALHVVEQSPNVEDGVLDLLDHSIGLPLGDLASRGIDQLVMAKLGQPDLRSALGAVVDCAALAKDLATKCVGPVCLGHQTDIANLCNAGLDAIVADVHAQLHAIAFDALRFHEGQAKMWDTTIPSARDDFVIERIDDGTWRLSLAFKIAGPEHPTSADFTGTRAAAASP
jgi:hypothetical protein